MRVFMSRPKAGVNIAGMQVARDHAGGKALMAITIDSAIDDSVVKNLKQEIGAELVEAVNLVI